jgi:hypothetical protein
MVRPLECTQTLSGEVSQAISSLKKEMAKHLHLISRKALVVKLANLLKERYKLPISFSKKRN